MYVYRFASAVCNTGLLAVCVRPNSPPSSVALPSPPNHVAVLPPVTVARKPVPCKPACGRDNKDGRDLARVRTLMQTVCRHKMTKGPPTYTPTQPYFL